jgi:hypothetical protein
MSRSKILDKTKSSLEAKDVVIILVIVFGFLLSLAIFLFRWPIPPIVSAVLLGTALSALVYRFLGGIQADTSFTIGALKLSGTMAALIGCIYFINNALEKQTELDLATLFDPPPQQWFSLEKSSGKPIEVRVGNLGSIPLPLESEIRSNPYHLNKVENQFLLFPKPDSSFPIGTLGQESLRQTLSELKLGSMVRHFIVTDRLAPATLNVDLDPLPFKLTTQTYSQDYSRFTLFTPEGQQAYVGSIYRKQAEIIRIKDVFYLVAVVEVNHQNNNGGPYAKFALGEIVTHLEN